MINFIAGMLCTVLANHWFYLGSYWLAFIDATLAIANLFIMLLPVRVIIRRKPTKYDE